MIKKGVTSTNPAYKPAVFIRALYFFDTFGYIRSFFLSLCNLHNANNTL